MCLADRQGWAETVEELVLGRYGNSRERLSLPAEMEEEMEGYQKEEEMEVYQRFT
jgi:hypothetical protein